MTPDRSGLRAQLAEAGYALLPAASARATLQLDLAALDALRDSWEREPRSEEHTSELQSRGHLVCRLLLEKKKKRKTYRRHKEIENTYECEEQNSSNGKSINTI